MTTAELIDRLLEIGTSVLGWTSAETLQTPMPHILLAYSGKIDWVQSTNPFGSGKSDPRRPSNPSEGPTAAEKTRKLFSAIGTRKVVKRGDSS